MISIDSKNGDKHQMQRVSFSSHLEEYFPVPGRDKFAADLSQKKIYRGKPVSLLGERLGAPRKDFFPKS